MASQLAPAQCNLTAISHPSHSHTMIRHACFGEFQQPANWPVMAVRSAHCSESCGRFPARCPMRAIGDDRSPRDPGNQAAERQVYNERNHSSSAARDARGQVAHPRGESSVPGTESLTRSGSVCRRPAHWEAARRLSVGKTDHELARVLSTEQHAKADRGLLEPLQHMQFLAQTAVP